MFLADDIVLFPFKGILSVFREIYQAALDEVHGEAEAIRNELSQLYQGLERGEIAEEAFDARESQLLDRLDEIEGGNDTIELDDEDDDALDEEDVGEDEYEDDTGDEDLDACDEEDSTQPEEPDHE